jgi:hypothetical protein
MAYGGQWPTVFWDMWALPRHKDEASLVKSPFFCHTQEYHAPIRKIPSTGQLRWLHHCCWQLRRELEVPCNARNPKK